jgi:uncharacterized membrane protein
MYKPRNSFLVVLVILVISLMILGSIVGSVLALSAEYSTDDDNHSNIKFPDAQPTLSVLKRPQIQNDFSTQSSENIIIKNERSNELLKTTPEKQAQEIRLISMPVEFDSPILSSTDGFSSLEMPGTTVTGTPGEPAVPKRVYNFKFKPGTEFHEIKFIPDNVVFEYLPEQLTPVPEPMPLSLLYEYAEAGYNPIKPDPLIYSTPELFPNEWFRTDFGLGIDSESGEHRIFVNVRIYPVQYTPVVNSVMIATGGELSIKYTPPTESNLNQFVTHGTTAPLAGSTKYKLLVITPERTDFIENLTRLVDFKTQTNLPAKLVTLTEINDGDYFTATGRDIQEKIKYFIYNATLSWNISYVILAGDKDQVPHRNVFISGSMAGDTPADLYYSNIFNTDMTFDEWDYDNDNIFGEYISGNVDRADMYPDVYLGRLPADTGSEMKVLVDKIITYESYSAGQPWFDNVTLSGTNTFAGTGTPEGEYAAEHIYNNYLQDFIPTKLYETTTYARDYPCTSTNIVNTLNLGSGFATFHDHGAPQSWAGRFSSTNALSLTNGDKLPFLNFDACSTGRFDDQDCISEKVVLNPNGGAITSIGASRIGWGAWGTNHINSNSGYFNVHLYANYYNGEGTAGRIFMGSKIDYMNNVGISSYHDYMTLTEFILFGDPSLSVGGIPLQNINITCDENTSYIDPAGSVMYEVTVTNNGSLGRPIKLDITGVPENWTAELNESLFIVPPMSSKKVSLTVTAADNALFDQIAHIEVFAYNVKNKARTISVFTHSITTQIFGVDINTSILEVNMYPTEEKGYWLKVNNLGNGLDTINLTANLVEPLSGWVFNFTEPNPLIQPFDHQIITVMVTAPEQTLFGTYELIVTGIVFGQPVTDTMILKVNILRTYGLDLESDDELSMKFNPAENFTYNLHASNLGNDVDKIDIIIERSPKEWYIELSRPKPFTVKAFKTRPVDLFFQIPNQTTVGYYYIRIQANLVGNSSQWEEMEFEIFVNQTYGFEISIDEPDVSAEPSEPKVFILNIGHLGNGLDTLDISVLNKPRDWYLNISESVITAEPFMNYEISVLMRPNQKATTGRYPFNVQVVLASNMETKSLGLNITVKPTYGFEVRVLKDEFEVAAGDAQSYKISVTNYGNHEDEIGCEITNIPQKWNYTVTPETIPTENIVLGPFNSTVFTVKIITDSKSIAGDYWVSVNTKLISTGDEEQVYLYTTVKPYYGVKLDSDTPSVRAEPGSDIVIEINITNSGNTRDNITREIQGLPPDWEFPMPTYTYDDIGAFEQKTEKIRITVPEDEVERDMNLTIRVYSETETDKSEYIKSDVFIVKKDDAGPRGSYNWNDLSGFFIFWLLPIILIVIVVVVMAILIRKQRKEYKEDMEFIRDMEQEEYDQAGGDAQAHGDDYSALYGTQTAQPHDTQRRAGAAGVAGTTRTHTGPSGRHRRRSRKIHGTKKSRSSARRPKPRHTTLTNGEKMKWLDDHEHGHDRSTRSRLPTGGYDETNDEISDEDDINKIECPACGELVNIDHDECPNCGEVFEAEDEKAKKAGKSAIADDYDVHLPDDEDADWEEITDDEEIEDWDDFEETDADTDDEEPEFELEPDDDEPEEVEEFEELEAEDDDDEVDWE